MDVSILQHLRDSSPQQVAVAEVVELIRGSQWPPGYQPLLIAASVVMGAGCVSTSAGSRNWAW